MEVVPRYKLLVHCLKCLYCLNCLHCFHRSHCLHCLHYLDCFLNNSMYDTLLQRLECYWTISLRASEQKGVGMEWNGYPLDCYEY